MTNNNIVPEIDLIEDNNNNNNNNDARRNLFNTAKSIKQTTRCTRAQLRRAAGSQSLTTLHDALDGWTLGEIHNIVHDEESGKGPLHMAAWQGCIENVQCLVEVVGCNINQIAMGQYCYGKTPLFFAVTRSREDVIEYLLSKGAHVKIVNNKGQSILSIAASHVSQYLIDKIRTIEQTDQQHIEWINYRITHSDTFEYGDLDPRFFIDRPIRTTDIVTPYVINPTTKQTRKGGFLRRNPDIIPFTNNNTKQKENHQQKQTTNNSKPKQQRQDTLSEIDTTTLSEAWESIEQIVSENTDLTMTTNTSIVENVRVIIGINDKRRQLWIPDTVNRLRNIFESKANSLYVLLDNLSARKDLLSPREIILVQKLIMQIDGISDDHGKNQTMVGSKRPTRIFSPYQILQDDGWKEACDIVKNLSITALETTRGTNCEFLTLPRAPQFIDTLRDLKTLSVAIETANLVAVDTEWDDNNNISTIQLAYDGMNSYIIDLQHTRQQQSTDDEERIYFDICRELLKDLFFHKIILGFAICNDIPKLEDYVGCPLIIANTRSHQATDITESDKKSHILDYQKLYSNHPQMPGLASCVMEFTSSFQLDKEQQCSNWGHRPLSSEQLNYAALDALILLYLLAEKKRQIDNTADTD